LRIGVTVFPGSNCDRDALYGIERAGAEPVELWHADADLKGVDAVVVPGGFSYGDYLRPGAIARFAKVMGPLEEFAKVAAPSSASATASRSSPRRISSRVRSS
jgi:phosphoribosylformylglycinamidine synthase